MYIMGMGMGAGIEVGTVMVTCTGMERDREEKFIGNDEAEAIAIGEEKGEAVGQEEAEDRG